MQNIHGWALKRYGRYLFWCFTIIFQTTDHTFPNSKYIFDVLLQKHRYILFLKSNPSIITITGAVKLPRNVPVPTVPVSWITVSWISLPCRNSGGWDSASFINDEADTATLSLSCNTLSCYTGSCLRWRSLWLRRLLAVGQCLLHSSHV